MRITKVTALFFSPCGNVKKVSEAIAEAAAKQTGCPAETIDITLPAARKKEYCFGEGELVIMGSPVYAGRVPNKIMPFFRDCIKSEGAIAAAVVCYGGRNFDNALSELAGLAEDNGFCVIGGSAAVTAHSFSNIMQPGRPGEKDILEFADFGKKCAEKALEYCAEDFDAYSVSVPGEYHPEKYYTPLGTDGQPAVFLKAVPKADTEKCNNCGKCAAVCPMGVIDRENIHNVTGPCIKCMACIKFCHSGARYFANDALQSHISMLESNYTEFKDNVFFV